MRPHKHIILNGNSSGNVGKSFDLAVITYDNILLDLNKRCDPAVITYCAVIKIYIVPNNGSFTDLGIFDDIVFGQQLHYITRVFFIILLERGML
jgi:hypothetical protein